MAKPALRALIAPAPALIAQVTQPFVSLARTNIPGTNWIQVRVNGSSLTIDNPSLVPLSDSGGDGFVIGNREDVPAQGWDGYIGELAVYDRVLTSAEMVGLEEYSRQRYATP